MATEGTELGSLGGLPEDLIPGIVAFLPPKSLLRFRAVRKAWRDLAANPDFISNHHSRQPQQPLILSSDVGPLNYRLDAVNLTANTSWMVMRVTETFPDDDGGDQFMVHRSCDELMVHGSCDGLLLLSFHDSFFVCNPATRQGTRLPLLLRYGRDVVGFYQHAESKEYRVLCYQLLCQEDELEAEGLGLKWSCSYYVLTLGSPQVRNIGRPSSSAAVKAGLERGLESSHTSPPVLLSGRLHWAPQWSQDGNILVFDQAAETFSWISPPGEEMLKLDMHDHTQLFEMEGKLAMFIRQQFVKNLVVLVMEDYDQMNWVYKYTVELSVNIAYQNEPLPPCPLILYQDGEILLPEQVEGSHKVLHCGNKGNLQGSVGCFARGSITPHMLKQSLALHDFLQNPRNDGTAEWFPELEFAG